MSKLQEKILKAISEGILNALDFTLDDFNDSDNDYILKDNNASDDESALNLKIRKAMAFDPFIEKIENLLQLTNKEKKEFMKLAKEFSWEAPDDIEVIRFFITKVINQFGLNCDLNWIDVSKVTDMTCLFSSFRCPMYPGCLLPIYRFNGNISKWDVSNVRSMKEMFLESFFNGDISKWDVSHVEDMESMFNHSKFNKPIENWDISRVKNMRSMFVGSKFNQPLAKWDVSNVKHIDSIFFSSNFNQDISNWDMSHAETSYMMFLASPLTKEKLPTKWV